ncbi:BEM1 [Candida oxycetoniae]|uniref:BEM1 n=1 Tax=Candida oxycetoniae TaxID=497107 RepID=A0AAI9SV26_9ASCO|nr:BEM1 [Candida oxycetoniae]KAI3403364.2 BEM1 [Candida oxycetoniae]
MPLFAVTLYEFNAERDDELDVSPGENLTICAHYDYEWFIAKPINRLGGPGLVPVSYVKVIDLMNPAKYASTDTYDREQVIKIIDEFKIPTVEEWKDQTKKYEASSINIGNTSTRSSSSNQSSRNSIWIEKCNVSSYQLYDGRYQYLITAKLSNGKTRQLYRYYQDFYDLQVKLLELFPYEAGKIENSKRTIPSIPGPLINVNDSISKLRREKLDFYLSNLIALPTHISRCHEVLNLFEVLNNGFDSESDSKRASKPISQISNSHQDRLSQYRGGETESINNSNSSNNNNNNTNTNTNSYSYSNSTNSSKQISKVKVKFYYQDDIFALLLPTNLRLQDLKTKLFKRLELDDITQHNFTTPKTTDSIRLFLRNDYEDFLHENNITEIDFNLHGSRLIEFEVDDDFKFHEVLFDKCKLIITVV